MATKGISNVRPFEAQLELWQKRFGEFATGSNTVDQLCTQVGVTAATFYCWMKNLSANSNSSCDSGSRHPERKSP